jgi:hypothetical protein
LVHLLGFQSAIAWWNDVEVQWTLDYQL